MKVIECIGINVLGAGGGMDKSIGK